MLSSTQRSTKRTVPSDVAKLFDPLGWAAPVFLVAKIFLQDLWLAGLDWDQPLPDRLRGRWLNYAASLLALDGLLIPRWTGSESAENVELHGFSDASNRAYAAAVYMRTRQSSGEVVV